VTTLDFSFSFDVSIFWEKAMTQSLFDFFVLRGWQLQQVDFRINEKNPQYLNRLKSRRKH
jgi:hypothetical protein